MSRKFYIVTENHGKIKGLTPNRFMGKICLKHPKLRGLRLKHERRCIACARLRLEPYKLRNRDINLKKWRDSARKRSAIRKIEVINHYGGKCRLCPIKDIDMLTLDHVNNDGSSHRRQLAKGFGRNEKSTGSIVTYRYVIKMGFPKGFRILCFNHNIKEHLKFQRKKLKEAMKNGY